MKSGKNLSIKWKMILTLAVSVLLPTLLLGVISYQTAEKKVEDQILQSARGNIIFLDQMITKYIEEETRSLDLLSELLYNRMHTSENPAQVRETLIHFLTSRAELTNVSLVSADQVLYTASAPSAAAQPFKAEWYRKAVENSGQVILGEPYLDETSKEMRVTLIRTLPDSTAAIAATMSLKDLGTQISRVKIGNEGYPYVLDRTRHYLVHPTAKLGGQTNTKQSIQMYSKPSGEFDYEFEGKQKKMFFTTNKATGWKLAGTIYVDEPEIAARPILSAMLWVMASTFTMIGIQNFFFIRSIVSRLRTFIQAARRVSEGDLSQTVVIKAQDEIGELAVEFNKMSEELRVMVQHVREKAEQLAASSEEMTASAEQTEKASAQIASIIQEVASGSEKQVHNVEMTSTTMDTMDKQIHDITEQANSLSHIAEKASEKANDGHYTIQRTIQQMNTIHQTVLQMGSTMDNLKTRSREIGRIVEVITTIADQTNLLALNAAIEAARAGESGRGFTVVADEVRKLAEQSATSAGQITDVIQTIQAEMEKAVETMKEGTAEVATGIETVKTAGQSFSEIQTSVHDVALQIYHVSEAARQVATSSEQIVGAVHSIQKIAEMNQAGMQEGSAATEEQLASMEQISASAENLSAMAGDLQQSIAQFKLQ